MRHRTDDDSAFERVRERILGVGDDEGGEPSPGDPTPG